MDLINRYPHMVHEYLVNRMKQYAQERDYVIKNLKDRKDAEQYVLKVKKAVKQSFGPLPEKTPLNPIITGSIDCGNYRIQKLAFESRPGFVVAANLYMPKKVEKPLPAVLVPCGHAEVGKAYASYQSLSAGFVSKGFAVLVYDPIGQGERRQYFKKDGVRHALGSSGEHTMSGKQQSLVGESAAMWHAWDGIRALDYLISRPEVDSSRIGVTGNSGGGTLTTYLSGLDERFCMAAAGCFMTTLLANLENELPTDSEMCPQYILKNGMDTIDILIAAAPRPTLILTQKYDYFDQRGAQKSFADIKRIYELLGYGKSIAYFMGPNEHGYYLENREAAYKFFMEHAMIKDSCKEPPIFLKKPRQLWTTPGGSVVANGSKRVADITAEIANKLSESRKKLSLQNLKKEIVKCLVIPQFSEKRHYRILRPLANNKFPNKLACQFALETEPGIQVITTCTGRAVSPYLPPNNGSVVLYLPHVSSFVDILSDPILKKSLANNNICAVDVRGIGDSIPNTCGTYLDMYRAACTTGKLRFFAHCSSDYMYAAYFDMFGETYLGRRVYDALCVMNFLYDNGVKEIKIAGRGLGSIAAAFAALLHNSNPKITIWNYLRSFHSLTQVPAYKWPFSIMPRGVLNHFDLPDVYEALGKRLEKKLPWNEKMQLR